MRSTAPLRDRREIRPVFARFEAEIMRKGVAGELLPFSIENAIHQRLAEMMRIACLVLPEAVFDEGIGRERLVRVTRLKRGTMVHHFVAGACKQQPDRRPGRPDSCRIEPFEHHRQCRAHADHRIAIFGDGTVVPDAPHQLEVEGNDEFTGHQAASFDPRRNARLVAFWRKLRASARLGPMSAALRTGLTVRLAGPTASRAGAGSMKPDFIQ